jgi:hypothetical protein
MTTAAIKNTPKLNTKLGPYGKLKKYDEQRPITQAANPAVHPIITANTHFFVNIAAIAAGIIKNA